MKLVRNGELSRAARVLVSSGLAPATEETVQKLAAKHPARNYEIPDMTPSANSETVKLSPKYFTNNIRNSPRGSGSGPSGWRYEHLRVLIDDPIYLFSACYKWADA